MERRNGEVEIMKVSCLPANMEERCVLDIVLLVTRARATETKAEADTGSASARVPALGPHDSISDGIPGG